MIAYMKDDEYIDLTPDYPYEIDKVFSNGYIKLKNGPRRYKADCFYIYHKGKQIAIKDAYRIYKTNKMLSKVGIRK